MRVQRAKPFRIIRGAKANYKTSAYYTRESRDRAARRFAEFDGETVLTEVWTAEQQESLDPINQGWACDGAVKPEGKS